MKIKQTSSIIGLFSIFAGLFITVFSQNPSPIIKYMLIFMLLGVSIFAYLTSSRYTANKVPSIDYWFTSAISIVYAIALFLYADSLALFLKISATFVLLFGITNFIFIFSVLNFRPKSNMKIILNKGVTGIAAALSGVLVFATLTTYNAVVALWVLGIIMILIGISFIRVSKYFVLPD